MVRPKLHLGNEISLIVFFVTLHIVGIPGQNVFVEHTIGEGVGEYGENPAMENMEPPIDFNEGFFTTARRQTFPGGGSMITRRTMTRRRQPLQRTYFQGINDLLGQMFQSPVPGGSTTRWSVRKNPNGVTSWKVQRGSRVVQGQRQVQPSSNRGRQNFINRVSKGRTSRVYPRRNNVIKPLPPSGPKIRGGTQFGLNGNQIQRILNAHNGARKELGASDMHEMRWNSRLAEESHAWARKCMFQHQQNGRGENLAMVYGTYTNTDTLLKTGLGGWYKEKFMWNFGDGFSSGTGHYTQMIWSSTKYVGCAAQSCPDMLYLVCFYSPAGNIMGVNPYTPGRTCSRCRRCNSGLCS